MKQAGPILVAVTDSEVCLPALSTAQLHVKLVPPDSTAPCPLLDMLHLVSHTVAVSDTSRCLGWSGKLMCHLDGWHCSSWVVAQQEPAPLFCAQASERAVEYALSYLAEAGASELLLVHVLFDARSLWRLVCMPRRPLARSTAFMQRRFAAPLSRAAGAGVPHRLAVLRGGASCARVSIAQALALEALEAGARAVVLASDGAPSALGRLLGKKPLASQVARAAHAPVIVAPLQPGGAAPGRGEGGCAPSPPSRKRVFLEAVSPRGGLGPIGAWRPGQPLPLPARYNKLRDEGEGGARGEGCSTARAAPRPLSPERAAGRARAGAQSAVDVAAYLRRAAEAQRRQDAATRAGT